MKLLRSCKRFWLIALLAFSPLSWADNVGDAVAELQASWAQIQYHTPEEQQASAFEKLVAEAREATAKYPDSASVWVWSGIIGASYAGAKGGLGALAAAKEAKTDLERAITIDGSVLDGAAYTSLGSLYYQVPGWPIGFGSDEKAEEYLRKGLKFGADDVDANYFYADYLFDQKDYGRALEYVERAEAAPRDPDRPVASEGRLVEVEDLNDRIKAKMR